MRVWHPGALSFSRYFKINIQFSLHSRQSHFETDCRYCFSFPTISGHFQTGCRYFTLPLVFVLWGPIFYFLFLSLYFSSILLYMECCPFINKQFNSDSFLDWKGHHWVFNSILQTTASDALRYIMYIYNTGSSLPVLCWWGGLKG